MVLGPAAQVTAAIFSQAAAVLLPGLEFAIAVKVRARVAVLRICLPHHRKPFRMPIRKRTKQHAFHQAEDRGVRANAQSQRKHRHERESRRVSHLADAVTQIAAQIREEAHPAARRRALHDNLRWHRRQFASSRCVAARPVRLSMVQRPLKH